MAFLWVFYGFSMGFLWLFHPKKRHGPIVPWSRPGFKWIAEAQLVPHPTRISGAGPSVTEPAADAGDAGPKFVLTPYGWRTVEQAGGLTQVGENDGKMIGKYGKIWENMGKWMQNHGQVGICQQK